MRQFLMQFNSCPARRDCLTPARAVAARPRVVQEAPCSVAQRPLNGSAVYARADSQTPLKPGVITDDDQLAGSGDGADIAVVCSAANGGEVWARVQRSCEQFRIRENHSRLAHFIQGEKIVLYTIAVVLLVLWVLGLATAFTGGGLIHALLVLAIIMIVFQVISGRRVG